MRLRLGLIDSDVIYLERFSSRIQMKYPGEFSLYTYTSAEEAYKGFEKIFFDVLLISEEVDINYDTIPKGIATIIMSQKMDIAEINGIPAFSKYHQTIADIYHDILAAYSELSKNKGDKKKRQNTTITVVTSVQGGSGVTTIGAALSMRKARFGSNILFLPLDTFGDVKHFFNGDGKRTFTDVIIAIKKGVNLEAALKSALKRDPSGVTFFDACVNAYDMVELGDSELKELLEKLLESSYDEVVVCYSGELNDRMLLLLDKFSNDIIYVNDGSVNGNTKFLRFCEAIRVVEQKKQIHIFKKMRLLYNRFSSTTGVQLKETAIPSMGGINNLITNNERLLAEKISGNDAIEW